MHAPMRETRTEDGWILLCLAVWLLLLRRLSYLLMEMAFRKRSSSSVVYLDPHSYVLTFISVFIFILMVI